MPQLQPLSAVSQFAYTGLLIIIIIIITIIIIIIIIIIKEIKGDVKNQP